MLEKYIVINNETDIEEIITLKDELLSSSSSNFNALLEKVCIFVFQTANIIFIFFIANIITNQTIMCN